MRRRTFLTGAAFVVAAGPTWAELGAPRFLAAANDSANRSFLVGLTRQGGEVFRLPIPTRGHAAAAHPTRALAVAFARRPGTFGMVIDCRTGDVVAHLTLPRDRHFYGHGAFSTDGTRLLTTENAIEAGVGRIGIWDVTRGFKRIADLPSGGIGPHEIVRLPSGGFAVANGGILTHPDFGRAKLNLPDMRPNLALLDADAKVHTVIEPPAEMRQNSIRHLDVDDHGRIWIALQWQGGPRHLVPLVAFHDQGQVLNMVDHPDVVRLKHYAGSIAVSPTGERVLVTGPKGDCALEVMYGDQGAIAGRCYDLPRASGVAATGDGFAVTGQGGLWHWMPPGAPRAAGRTDLSWDNHLVTIT